MKLRWFIISALVLLAFTASAVFAGSEVDINTASLEQLDELSGIGPVYAQRIVDNRPFSSVDDLDRVKGIGPATLAKIKEQGLACVNCTPEATIAPPPPPPPPEDDSALAAPVAAAITYPSGIFINEILPNPDGADETEEWLELYNSNDTAVDLSGWIVKDSAGSITTFAIPQNTKIMRNGFKTFTRPETRIMLNNDEDGLELLTPDNKIVDFVAYSKAPLGQSYSRVLEKWSWSTTLTPGTVNIITAVAAVTPSGSKGTSSVPDGLPKAQKSDNSKLVQAGLASLSQEPNLNPWFLFFTVLAATLILATTVLLIKFKFNKNVRT